ncbi:FAD-dependent oxidoreductase [bacterium]|nr:FAD-dependent oxidoreductase [bacterium]
MTTNTNPTLILGAGPAGLAAGYYLSHSGFRPLLLEAADEPGGFARTYTHREFRYDAGAHRFHDKDPEITSDLKRLMGPRLLHARAPSQICWKNTFLDFPLSPLDLIIKMGVGDISRAAWDLVRARCSRSKEQDHTLETQALHRYGKAIANSFLIGYSEKLWGVPANRLLPEVSGGRLKGLTARTVFYELVKGKRSKTAHLDGSFYYPRNGYGEIADHLAEAIGRDNILTRRTISRISHDRGRLVSIHIDGVTLDADEVVSTLGPLRFLSLLDPKPPRDILDAASSLKFRDLLLVVVFLNRPRVSNNASIYFPSLQFPFTRLHEPKNRSPEMAPPNQTCVVVEIPCFPNDPICLLPHHVIAENTIEQIESLNLFKGSEVIDTKIHYLSSAYPVLEIGSEALVESVMNYLRGFENLHTVGRAGRFEYKHVHDLMKQGKELAARLTDRHSPSASRDSE